MQQVNQLLQQHRQMKKMMKQVASGKTPNMGGPQGAQMATRPRAAGARKNKNKKRRR